MRCLLPLLLAFTCHPLLADVVHQDITLDTRDGMIVFANDAIALGIDLETGSWRELSDCASGRTLMSAPQMPENADARIENEWFLGTTETPWSYSGRRTHMEGDCAVLEVDQEAAGWKATVSYRLWPGRPVLRRDLALTPTVETTEIARNVRLMMNGVAIGSAQDARYSILANWPPHMTQFSNLSPGTQISETYSGSTGHFVIAHSQEAQLGLVAAMICETESSGLRVTEQDAALRIDHLIWTIFRPRLGKTERFGSQLVCVTHGGWRDALRQGRDLYDLVSLAPPADMLEEAKRTVFYSAHPGGSIDSGFRDVGGFAQFAKGLPELKRLGINVLWLLPFWEGPVYAPIDYYALDPRLGTEEDLAALVEQAHSLGIRVLGDLIPHGPRDASGLHEQHRDWVSTNEDGTMQYWWGCLSCDYAHPGWQNYMGDHAAHWVKKVGLDGYRVDCAAGGPTNWQPHGNNRPTMSNTYGGLQVLRVAREKMREVKDEVLLLAEASGPPLLRYADYAYDWPLCWNILNTFPQWRTEEFVSKLARWLENEQYWLPKDANLIHFLENHDSVRARMIHGPGPERALMALCAFIPGSPFVYHFQEIGMAPCLSRLYELRRKLPELTKGEADFLSVECDRPEVLVFTRDDGEHTSIVTINFSERTQEFTLALPEEMKGFTPATAEVLRGMKLMEAEVGQIHLWLGPFETAVIVASGRGAPRPPAPPRTDGPRDAALEVTEVDGDVIVQSAAMKLVVGRDNGGLIKRLEDSEGNVVFRALGIEEGRRRLYLGAERISLGSRPTTELSWERTEGFITVTVRGSIMREAAGPLRPVMDYVLQYRVNSGSIYVSCSLTAREPIENVLGSLVETFQFDPHATKWAVLTQEGFLHDWAIARRPSDTRYSGRYWRGTGDRVWQSRDIPSGMRMLTRTIAIQSPSGLWTHFHCQQGPSEGVPHNVMLKMRDGEAVGPHVRVEWLGGERPVTLRRGQALGLWYSVSFGNNKADALRLMCEKSPTAAQQRGGLTLRVRGSRYELSNGKYDLAISRFGGGRIADLRLAGDTEALIQDSRIYTDGGIYADRITPSMEKIRNFVSSSTDPEAEMRITREDGRLLISFEGYLRSHNGRSTPSPRTRYRVSYEMDASEALKVKVAVKPYATIPQAKAFLAQTLSLPRFNSFQVNAKGDLAEGTPEPGSQRVWESKRQGFADDPWMLCKTGAGRSLRIAGPDLARAFQNAFLFRSGGEAGIIFLAFNDFEPADIQPIWYEAEYTITPLKDQ